MPENNQYPDNQHGTFTPVAIVLIVAITAVLGVFIYARTAENAPSPPASVSPSPVNPNAPVVPGTGIAAEPPRQP